MFNIFNNAKTLYGAYNGAQKKKTDLYSGPIASVYQKPQGAPRSQMIGNKSVAVTGSSKAPQSFYTPASISQKKAAAPPAIMPSAPQVKQPTASEVLQQKYANYLTQSEANKAKLAEQTRVNSEADAMDEYNANKSVATSSRANLEEMMKGFRERSAASQARLDTQAKSNRERAKVQSGETQREMMETRRDQLGDTERRYSALGTVDSYGTGSFQSANQNVENDFLRMTAKNKEKLQNDLLDIDNKLFDAKANAEEKLAIEESKYKDAVLKIEELLANNEVGKNKAIRAAKALFDQKTADIYDEYEGYRIQAEQDKVKKQEEIDAANAGDTKLKEIMSGASQEFMTTGVPKTAQDRFIIMKYPKEMETFIKMLGSGDATDLRKEFAGRVGTINYQTVVSNLQKIQNAPDNAAGDMGMIFAYMKLLDPSSTVREGEYATAQNATGVPQSVLNQYNSVLQGRRLNPAQREQFASAGAAYAKPTIDQYNQAEQYYAGLASKSKVNPNDVTGGYVKPQLQGMTNVITAPDGQQIMIID